MSFPYWPGSPQIFQQLAIDGENLSIVPFGNTVQLPTTYSSLTADHISTTVLDANDINVSTIFAYEVFIDNQGLTATPTELLLNGIPIATSSNLSTIADWSLDPAIANVYMDNFNLLSTSIVDAKTTSSLQGLFSSINTNKLYANSILCEDLTALSSIHSYNYTSSVHLVANDAQISSLNGLNVNTISSSLASSSNVSQWASYPAVANVQMNGRNITTNAPLSITADTGTNLTVPTVNIVSQNGLGGAINLTANTGDGGTSYGAITLTANGGVTSGIGTGGSINIVANTPLSTPSNATSKISLSAAGINSYAGAVPPVGSLLGYNFTYGTLGINNCVGLPSVIPNFPGTYYCYAPGGVGYGGIRFESPAGVEMIDNTDLYIYRMYPYYNPFFVGTPSNGLISGRVAGGLYNQYMDLSNIGYLKFGFANARTGVIDFLSSINGASIDTFQAAEWSRYPAITTVTASNISGSNLSGIQFINGQPISYYEPGGVSTVSTFVELTTSSLTVSSINGQAYPPPVVSTFTDLLVLSNTSTQTLNVDFINGYTGNSIGFGGNPIAGTSAYFDTALNMLQIDSNAGSGYPSAVNVDTVATDALTCKNGTDISVFATQNFNMTQTRLRGSNIELQVSTLLTAETTFPALVVRNATDNSVCQVNASFYAIGDINQPFQGGYGYASTFDRAAVLNSSLQTKYIAYTEDLQNLQNNSVSTVTLEAGKATVSSLTFTGPSTITFGTAATAGSVGQPAGRLLMTGQDLDLGQNDLWAQQIRIGFGNPGGSAQPEIIFYPPDGTNPKQLNVAGSDATLRITSTINSGTGGYLLDTFLNPVVASTINNSVNLMARFPAPTTGSAGYSTMTVIPNYIFSAYSSTSQTVVAANTATNLTHNTVTTNVGGFTNLGSTITVPVAGVYEIGTSIQFVTSSGGTNPAFFWLKKNGSNVDQTNSKVSIVNNGDTIGTVTFFDTAAANDKYTIAIESADTNMRAGAIAATGDMPAVPSVITNIKKIG